MQVRAKVDQPLERMSLLRRLVMSHMTPVSLTLPVVTTVRRVFVVILILLVRLLIHAVPVVVFPSSRSVQRFLLSPTRRLLSMVLFRDLMSMLSNLKFMHVVL